MILIHKTFEEITPESAEDGENSDSGFIWDNVEVGFRELVVLMKEYNESSCYPAKGDTFEWYSTGFYTECYRTGTERNQSIHYSNDNPTRNAKYWMKAARAAGIVKK